MLKIRVLAVGKIKERYIQEGVQDYQKRLKPFLSVEIIELKSVESVERYAGSNTYLLDAAGKESASEEFAQLLKKQDGELQFIIGDAEGFSPELKKKFKLMSLSKMTFPHEMCQLFLVEQIYRACMINNNRQYHK